MQKSVIENRSAKNAEQGKLENKKKASVQWSKMEVNDIHCIAHEPVERTMTLG